MTSIELLNVIFGAGLAVLGWFARELWSAVKNLKEDLIKFKEDVSTYYVRKDDFKEFRGEILSFLQRIENKLDQKQDK
jgi:hypothetical protein